MDRLYEVDESDYAAVRGLQWIGPERFPFSDWQTIARVDKRPGGDGQSVIIQECAMPARFFRLLVQPEPNSCGEPQVAYEVSTGSICPDIVTVLVPLARLIADGMVGFRMK